MLNNQLLVQGATGYNLSRSLRFRSSASSYLSRTPASTTNQKTFTISMWVKRGNSGSNISLVSCRSGSSPLFQYQFYSDNTLSIEGSSAQLRTTQVFRDFSAWYHIVLAIDTTQATSSDRIKMYVNGAQITSFGTATYPSQNTNFNYNVNSATSIGSLQPFDTQYFDGYMAEIHSIDGQALTPSSFGQTSSTTGVWQPKKYAGTYGTNGFYLPFTDNSALTSGSNAGLGKDFSGNGNYWNTNNISITSGSTYDSMTDVPTLTSATASNFCTLNPIGNLNNERIIPLTNGNLKATNTGSPSYGWSSGTIGVTSGKWYWETTIDSITSSNYSWVGACVQGLDAGYYQYQRGVISNPSGSTTSVATSGVGDIVGIALDITNLQVTFYKNGSSLGTISISTYSGLTVFPYSYYQDTGNSCSFNFGQRPFAYTPPTGYVALNTFNLPTPTIGATASSQANKYFDATTYTGTGVSGLAITNAGGFKPDFVWVKVRNASDYHNLADSVRGVYKRIFSNDTQVENTNTETLQSFNSNGFTVGNNGNWNTNGAPLVAWQWKGGGTGVTNTAGSITSTVSANTTSGFSIVTYTGNGSAGSTIGHGLGVAPKMVIVKCRNATSGWIVGTSSLGFSGNYWLVLNTTNAATNATYNMWNSTNPSSTVVTLGNDNGVNVNGQTYVAYCFSEIAGFSKFGSYTGNGSSDGVFVYTGFRPKFVMWKCSSTSGNWYTLDSSRDSYNLSNHQLLPNQSIAEVVQSGDSMDFTSNGFKLRGTGAETNGNGQTFIYMAFAENPFKYSLAR